MRKLEISEMETLTATGLIAVVSGGLCAYGLFTAITGFGLAVAVVACGIGYYTA